MKNTIMKLVVLSMLSCVGIVAWAENVLYIHPLNDSSSQSGDAFGTKNYAFADKITTSVTVAIWVRDVTATYQKFLAGVNGRWNLARLNTASAETNKKLAFRTESGNVMTDGGVLTDHSWHFIVGTFNYDAGNSANSFQRLYVDGALASEKTDGIIAISAPDKMFTLGGSATDMSTLGNISSVDGLFGHFAELSVWNRALSAAEVSGLYTRTTRLASNESGLVAYWPLTGMPGMAAADYSFPNLAATTGVPNLTSHWTALGSVTRVAIEDDDGFDKPYARFVASPEWCAANAYVQAPDATGRSWADPLTNLVETAAAAKKFERILCSPGTHKISSPISPLVEYFYLGSSDPATGEPCPETAIIDAQESCRHFISSSSATGESNFTVENLTFVNGRESNGGSMYFSQRVGNINNCIFRGNAATNGWGGAYYANAASGTVVSNCQFYGNSAYGNGTVALGGAVFLNVVQRFDDCVFSNNTVTATSGIRKGGAIYGNCKFELENCIFADNTIAGSGDAYGGHAFVGINTDMKGCEFTGTCMAQYGSCLHIENNPVTVTNCVFRNMTCSGTSYRFITLSNNGTGSKFVDCIFTNNANKSSLFYQNSKNLLFWQCLIADNASGQPVLHNAAGSAVFENCTIPQALFHPATVSAATTNTLVNCILPNATVASADNYCNILSNCLVKAEQGGPFDSGVITGEPKFTDAANGDYTLDVKSPCRDKGLTLAWMTSGSTDLLGNPRVVDTNGKAFSVTALPDLGCYEIQDRLPTGLIIIVK